MSLEKRSNEKARLHPRNKNREHYDLDALILSSPDLKEFIIPNKKGVSSVDFSNPKAVKLLNKAILNHYYGIKYWEFPDKNLCPPIPGRADYIHHVADLIGLGIIPNSDKITCLDIGIGASCIYPIIGATEYNWNFIGSDIDPASIASAEKIIENNSSLTGKIECRLQSNSQRIFNGIIKEDEKIDLVVCNPPFHASAEEARKGNSRKVKNLTGRRSVKAELNFSGIQNELIYDGGESKFIQHMVRESKDFSKNCMWFSTLVSKQSHVLAIQQSLEKARAFQIKTIPLGTGNKSSRIIAWTFLSSKEQKEWKDVRWGTVK